jgi:predicted RNA methylase
MTAVTDLRAFHVARASYMNVRRAWGSVVHDRRLGIDTSREVRLSSLGLAERDRVDYEPSGWSSARIALDRLTVEPDDVLIDLGSGKGRVVLEAAQRPFRRVIGVELSPELTRIARSNLAASRGRLRCQDVQLVTADVTSFEMPDDVTVVYLCNPFGGEVFTAALDAMIASVDRAPRRVRISYSIPREHDRLMASGRVRHVGARLPWRPTHEWSQRAGLHEYELMPEEDAGDV